VFCLLVKITSEVTHSGGLFDPDALRQTPYPAALHHDVVASIDSA